MNQLLTQPVTVKDQKEFGIAADVFNLVGERIINEPVIKPIEQFTFNLNPQTQPNKETKSK